MNTSNCNHCVVDEFLQQIHLPSVDDTALQEHLDCSSECQSYFDSKVADAEFWRETTDLLRPTDFDMASCAEFSAGSMGTAPVGSLKINDVLARLAPSDDPHSLGRIGGYEVTGVVGAGAMGVVLKAFDTALDRVVAIKVLAQHLANSGTARRRFEREAKAVAAIHHPNVIPVHSVSSEGDHPFFVMSYIRGISLQKRLDEEGPLRVGEVLRIGHQIAAGLSASHAH